MLRSKTSTGGIREDGKRIQKERSIMLAMWKQAKKNANAVGTKKMDKWDMDSYVMRGVVVARSSFFFLTLRRVHV